VFDALQARKIRDRKRKRGLLSFLSQLRDAAATLPDGTVVLDRANRVQWFNPAARKYLGLQWPRDAKREVTTAVTDPVFADFLARQDFSRALEIPSPVNGAVMLSVQVAPFRETRQSLLVARDITRFYHLDQSHRDFVASVSHELRTPLTVFRGFLETMQDTAAEHLDWAEPLGHLDQQASRMQDLVEDLLTLSRLDSVDRVSAKTTVDVTELLHEIGQEARALIGPRGHKLSLDADPRLALRGVPEDFRSVFSNLIFNAVKHTPDGTNVDIVWRRSDDGAVFLVADDGSGIARYHLPRLTERFYRVATHRAQGKKGTGLGLAIVKRVLDRYRADLRIASTPTRGSTFSCHFPQDVVVATKHRSGSAW
jgi:two-component system phosphate regulon sensor histidine kinase PhoR